MVAREESDVAIAGVSVKLILTKAFLGRTQEVLVVHFAELIRMLTRNAGSHKSPTRRACYIHTIGIDAIFIN
jgi:hypothetical protein